MFLRLSTPEAFAGDYRRILYLDADIHVHGGPQAGDFGRLLDADLGGRAVGAVRDNKQWLSPRFQPALFRDLGLTDARYLNSGVLLLDVAAFNRDAVLGACVRFARDWTAAFADNDQGLLNAVLQGNWAELSPVWNWQQTLKIPLLEARYPVAITHFIGPCKPWNDHDGRFMPKYRQAYHDFLGLYYPQIRCADPRPRRAGLGRIVQTTAKSLLRARPIRSFLSRFSSPYDAL